MFHVEQSLQPSITIEISAGIQYIFVRICETGELIG